MSDYCIISTGLDLQLSGLKHQKDFDENCFHTCGNFMRSDDCKDTYVEALVKPKSETRINSLYTELNVEIKITTVYTEADFKNCENLR